MTQTFPDIDAPLEREQRFFDHVRAAREETREQRANAWRSAGNAKDRARLKANAESDETLGHPDEPVAFLRIDTDDGDCLYVGEHGVSGPSKDRLVYSWRAPAVLHMRGATHEDTRGVARRRTYSVQPVNSIVDLEDLVLAELARRVTELGTTEPELLGADEFLQGVLARGRSPEMQTIVQTIQAAQADVIAAPGDQLLVVQGGPGTGKTAVALHRVAALLFGELRDRPGAEVLVVGPNPTFLRYISRVLPELGEQSVRQNDIGRLMSANVSVSVAEQPAAARLKGDDRMVEVLARALSDRLRPPTDDVALHLEDVSWSVTLTAAELTELIDEIDGVPYTTGRQRFRAAVENRVAVHARRHQKANGRSRAETPRPRPSDVDAAIERIWPQLTPAAFLREFYGSLERLVTAAGSTLTADEVRLLRRQAAPRIADQLWSKEDLPLLDHVAWEMSGDVDTTYAHIVVDEAQDLSPMQLLALRRRSAAGAMTIVGDIAQSTGHWARDRWDDLVTSLTSPLPQQMIQLGYGYRVPRGVMDVAARLLPHAAPGIEPPTVIRDVDRAPQWHEVAAPDDRFERVVQVVREHSGNGLFVGVVCPDASRRALESAFASVGIQWNDADKGGLAAAINVVSPGASKGLEFDAVVVVDPKTIVDAGPHGLRMLYIALTRTTGYLDLVYESGQIPAELRRDPLPADDLALVVPERSHPEVAPHPPEDERSAPSRARVVDDGQQADHLDEASTGVLRQGGGDVSQRRDRQGRTSAAPNSVRSRSVAFNAQSILELLDEVAPAHMWREILEEAMVRLPTGPE